MKYGRTPCFPRTSNELTMFYPVVTFPNVGFPNYNVVSPFGNYPSSYAMNTYNQQHVPVESDLFVNFETAQKSFELARKKASAFKRDCFSLYVIEHQNDNAQNETYRHIATSYNSNDLKQFADQNDEYGLYFIAEEVIAADGSRYAKDGKHICGKDYIPQDGVVYHSSAGVLFDMAEFEPAEVVDMFEDETSFEKQLDSPYVDDELTLSYFSDDSEITKTLSDISHIFVIDEEEDDRDFAEMAKRRNALYNIRQNTMDAYLNVRLNKFFSKGFHKGNLGSL